MKLLGWIGRCGKNKITLGEDLRKPKPVTLDGEEHRKPITEYRKPKSVTLDGEEYKKPITEYKKPSGMTDNLGRS